MLERKKYRLHVRVFLSRYRGYAICLIVMAHGFVWRRARFASRANPLRKFAR